MPTAPKSIKIEFVAQDKGLRKELEAISKAQQSLNKATKKTTETQETAQKQLSELNRELSDNFKTMQDVERQEQRNLKATIQGKDAKKASTLELKKETTQRKSHLDTLKKDIISRSKASEIAKKQAKANQILSTSIKTNRAQLKLIDKELKSVGVGFGKAGVGAGVLKQALRGNSKAMATVSRASKILIKDLKKVNTGLFSITNNGRLVVGSFATIRSKMLLASFAASLVSKAFVSNVEAFGKQQDSVQRLASVFGNEGATSLANYASELQKVTTFGDENTNAAMAQMGAFGASTEQTKTLTKATLDLSAGMGIDLNTAALLVAKSFGTSTNALGRYGVELDSNMTKEEKVAAIAAKVEERYGGLAKQLAQTTSGQLAQAKNAFGDLAEVFGRTVAPAILAIAKLFKFLSEAIDIKIMRTLAASTLILVTGFTALAYQTKIAAAGQAIYQAAMAISSVATAGLTASLAALKAALISTGVGGLIVAIGALVPLVMNLTGVFDDNNYLLDENGKRVRKLTEEEIKLAQAQKDGEKALIKKLAILKATTEAEKEAIRQNRELSSTELQLMQDIKALNIELKEEERINKLLKSTYDATLDGKIKLLEADLIAIEMSKDSTEMTEDEIVAYDTLVARVKELKDARSEMSDEEKEAAEQSATNMQMLRDTWAEASAMFIEHHQQEIEQTKQLAQAKIDVIRNQMNQELAAERQTWAYKKSTDKQKEKLEKEIIARHEKREKKVKDAANKRIREEFETQKKMNIAQTVMSTATAVMRTLEKGSGFFSTPLAMVVAAMGAAQIKMIKSQKAPVMQYGGLVGGRRHSAGGTMIEAEQGEFVVSRAGVEATGLETLNRINAGTGGAAGTSIVINNPIIGKDTIEDEIVPQIKEALRRGGDIEA